MPMPDKLVLLDDFTGAANTAFSRTVVTTDLDVVGHSVTLSGGVTPASLTDTESLSLDAGATFPIARANTISTGVANYVGATGKAVDATSAGAGGLAWNTPLGSALKLDVPAFGIGITARLIVWARRPFKGPSIPQPATGD